MGIRSWLTEKDYVEDYYCEKSKENPTENLKGNLRENSLKEKSVGENPAGQRSLGGDSLGNIP